MTKKKQNRRPWFAFLWWSPWTSKHTQTQQENIYQLKKKWGWWFYNWWWDIQFWNFACEIWLLILASVLEIFFLVGCNFKSRDYFQHFFQLKVVISQRKKEKCFQITTTTKEIVHFHEKNTFGEAASFYCICIPW